MDIVGPLFIGFLLFLLPILPFFFSVFKFYAPRGRGAVSQNLNFFGIIATPICIGFLYFLIEPLLHISSTAKYMGMAYILFSLKFAAAPQLILAVCFFLTGRLAGILLWRIKNGRTQLIPERVIEPAPISSEKAKILYQFKR
ncbi:hypothetical protein [Labrenzia sp. CE80]|uniref:hypothetical protein n=1 Tax=Labrenzia sp. CE80 TaxID=1788986 RepID=UPI00129BE7B2|nr:hypothetical protein [Labrenzia sp. CE80]